MSAHPDPAAIALRAPGEVPVPASSPVLDIRGLSIAYRTPAGDVNAVRDVDLELHPGRIVGLAGESGCGKSTLAYGSVRLLRPPALITGGSVMYRGRRVGDGGVDILAASSAQLRALRWREIAIVFQSAMNALNPVLRVRDQLLDAITAHLPISPDEAHDRAERMIELVGIDKGRLRAFPHELSGGMRQRVMIAMALAVEPEVVIMDEPTTGLDVVVQREILKEVFELKAELGFSVLFITHDLSLLLEIADQVLIMYAGRVVEASTTALIRARPAHPYTRGLLSSFPRLRGPREKLTGIPGSPPDLLGSLPGCPFVPRCGFARAECREVDMTLQPVAGTGSEQLTACPFDTTGTEVRTNGTRRGPTREEPLAAAGGGALVLEAVGLRKEYKLKRGESVTAVQDVSFALHQGAVVALVGESGSGKSTIAKLLAGQEAPSSGSVRLDGVEITPWKRGEFRAYKSVVQLVFQDPFASLNPLHTVRYHLQRALAVHGKRTGSAAGTAEVDGLLEQVSLTPVAKFRDAYPHELSGGQRQRVAFARALAARPRVLLADEPVSMLDVSIRLEILDLIAELRSSLDIAVLYITHDIASARYFADEILVLNAGRVVERGPAEQLTQAPQHPYTQLLIASSPDPDSFQRAVPRRGEGGNHDALRGRGTSMR